MSLSINLKIQAKSLISRYGKVVSMNTVTDFNILYSAFENDAFMLPYKCQKLSKRARRGLV